MKGEQLLMEASKRENKRKSIRYFSQLKAQYFLEREKRNGEECTIINISQKGMGVKFHTPEKINIGSIVHLKTFIPTEMEPVNIKGVLIWFEPLIGGKSIGGVELAEELDGDRFAGLCSIYAGEHIAE